MTDVHPDLEAERAYLAEAYRHLAAMHDRAARAAAVAEADGRSDVDSKIAGAHLRHRQRSLDADVAGLAFGRLDDEDGDRWYVGRRHVEDATGDPVVVDWRAPISTPFYRATAADPLGLRLRRRFVMTGHEVDDLFDEDFDDPDSVDAAHHGGIPDPLLAELERSRTGAMRDIVATIAAEQDVIIRAPLDTCLVVQGGPGTGKTAVGLHRAAFLLYEHRPKLDREGVLVVGPNPLFLRYIAQVLPSLGEAATRQSTIERLVSGAHGRVRAFDTPAVARLKGDARMALVLARGARDHLRPPTEDARVSTPWGPVRLPAEAVAGAVDEVLARGVPFGTGRTAFRTRLARLARLTHEAARGEDAAPADAFESAWRSNAEANALAGKVWPSLSAPALVKKVLTGRTALRRAAEGILDATEQDMLLRKAGAKRLDDETWSLAELVLVDEAEALLNGVTRTYGHVVVDEAQDLSAMEVRAIARRCPSRSMTVLGDLAQATAPAAQSSWDDVVALLGEPAAATVEELAVGYRVPAPIIELANRLLPSVAPNVTPSSSVREVGRAPEVVACASEPALADEVATRTAALADVWASVGVVVPDALADAVAAALTAAGVAYGVSGRPAGDATVTLLSPPEAKGLEFDAVVVAEPAGFTVDGIAGGRLLYIALTRAVQELTIVHAAPLPDALAA